MRAARLKLGAWTTTNTGLTAAWRIARRKSLHASGQLHGKELIRMKGILRFGGSAPKPPGFAAFFSPEWALILLTELGATSAAAPCLSGRCNRSLGLHPCIALSRPVQVRSVCVNKIRLSRQKWRSESATTGNSTYDW